MDSSVVCVFVMCLCLTGGMVLGDQTRTEVWAVLVAGSSGWGNYRHQADVCHAYQILHSQRVPDDHIVVFMYDDLAYNVQNNKPGKIYNDVNGTDVYTGVPKDYIGADVTAEHFLAVITGNSSGVPQGKKILKSGPKDHVFIYFTDHGSVGLIAFPNGYLYADQLADALDKMHNKKQYGALTFYLEACESGSMFYKHLPEDVEIYSHTASNPTEPSYACSHDPQLKAYLSDCWSLAWMKDTEAHDPTEETLQQQFENVRGAVSTSESCQYGDRSLASKFTVADFMGQLSGLRRQPVPTSLTLADLQHAVPSWDVDLAVARFAHPQHTAQYDVEYELEQRRAADYRAAAITRALLPFTAARCPAGTCGAGSCACFRSCAARGATAFVCAALCCPYGDPPHSGCEPEVTPAVDFGCYRELITEHELHCGPFTSYSLKNTRDLALVRCTRAKCNRASF
eukprot:TRINITY_DN2051_c0_g2_i4.p1 TRINITY_DN2051_c0_g2~~TRINITY_DN2051_c0_g2_i4.p1  ORF type:complete len:455 (-),score=97.39 TRINITY_DN2051_c0_g2_i4:16-1380(-)